LPFLTLEEPLPLLPLAPLVSVVLVTVTFELLEVFSSVLAFPPALLFLLFPESLTLSAPVETGSNLFFLDDLSALLSFLADSFVFLVILSWLPPFPDLVSVVFVVVVVVLVSPPEPLVFPPSLFPLVVLVSVVFVVFVVEVVSLPPPLVVLVSVVFVVVVVPP
jgi:hypothetical protein